MMIKIERVLSEEALVKIRENLTRLEWVDGSQTAGTLAKLVKRNLQFTQASEAPCGLQVMKALKESRAFGFASFAHKISVPLFARYEIGMEYGNHTDDALMGELRTDLAATLFLSDPTDYTGGSLVIEDTYGPQAVKLSAGDLVLYPASSVHRVTPVLHGVRQVAVFWVQSLVRNPEHRQILWTLRQSFEEIAKNDPEHPQIPSLSASYHSLLRLWSDL